MFVNTLLISENAYKVVSDSKKKCFTNLASKPKSFKFLSEFKFYVLQLQLSANKRIKIDFCLSL